MLAARFATGLMLVAGLLAAIFADEWMHPWYPLWFLVAAVALVQTALELVGLLSRTSARPSANTVVGGVLALLIANWLPHLREAYLASQLAPPDLMASQPGQAAMVVGWPMWTFVSILMLTFVAQSIQFERPGRTMATIAGTVLTIAYVGLLGGFIVQMRWLGGPRGGVVALLTFVATAKGADIGAYTLGRIAGRHKLWPRLSPNKTIEGALGGLALGVAGSLGMTALARALLDYEGLSWGQALVFGVLVGIVAQLGDLMESMIKRDCVQKDASDALPGFGGLLDVMDSLLFSAPVAYGFWVCCIT